MSIKAILKSSWALCAAWMCAAMFLAAGSAAAQSITMASTTSTEQSGLFGYLLPEFKKATGLDIKVVAVGTGQAIDMARRGDADVLFVHDQAAEEKFVAEGGAVKRFPVMYNDFVLVGPKGDPAGTRGKDILAGAEEDFRRQRALHFARRQERHSRRRTALLGAGRRGKQRGGGYKECGCGMGPALNIGSSASSYVLTDRGTWLSFKNRGDLAVLVEGDTRLFNQYGVMVVNPAKYPHLKSRRRAEVRRLDHVAGGPVGHRRLQDQWPAAVLPERRPVATPISFPVCGRSSPG